MSAIVKAKRVVGHVFDRLGLSDTGLLVLKRMHRNRFIRVVNYHDTPPQTATMFGAHLTYYESVYVPVSERDLYRFLFKHEWPYRRPGLIITFDDGLRSNYDVAVPQLESKGFSGWFFIPTSFVDTPISDQRSFARKHRIAHRSSDDRIAMSWRELGSIDGRHHIGCHTATHCRLERRIGIGRARKEIFESKSALEARLGHPVASFCWVGGELSTYNAEAAQAIREAGYRYAFQSNSAPVTMADSAHQLQRTNIEAHWPLSLVKLQLSGVMDIVYTPKRLMVKKRTK